MLRFWTLCNEFVYSFLCITTLQSGRGPGQSTETINPIDQARSVVWIIDTHYLNDWSSVHDCRSHKNDIVNIVRIAV